MPNTFCRRARLLGESCVPRVTGRANDHRGDRPDGTAGYSLLELIIVLLIIIGMLALVWPALSRPMATNDLQEAAAGLRAHLGQARTLAMTSGEPVLVRIEHNSGEVTFATWSHPQLVAAPLGGGSNDRGWEPGLDSADSLNAEPPPAEAPGLTVERWAVPESITVQRVVHARAEPPSSASTFGQSDPLEVVTAFEAPDDSDEFVPEPNAALGETGDLLRVSWLWFLPQGQASEATVELVDVRTRRQIELSLTAWNGDLVLGKPQRMLTQDEESLFGESDAGSRSLDDRRSASDLNEDPADVGY